MVRRTPKKNHRRRNRSQKSPKIDLFNAAFGLPIFRELEPARKRVPQDTIDYDCSEEEEEDDDDDDSATEDSTSVDDDEDEASESYQQPLLVTPKRRVKKPRSVSTRGRQRRRSSSATTPKRRLRSSTPHVSKKKEQKNSVARSFVRPSASFPPQFPVQITSNPSYISTPSPSFSQPALPQQFVPLPANPQQTVYFQPQLAFVHASSFIPDQQNVPIHQPPPPLTALHPAGSPAAATVGPPVQQQISQLPQHGSNSPNWAKSSGPFARELQRIQSAIDFKMAELAQQPHDPSTRNQLRALQDELNSTLNSAIAKKKAFEGKAKNKGEQSVNNEHSPAEGASPSRRNCQRPGDTQSRLDEANANKKSGKDDKSDDVPTDIPRRHLCSGCGCVRSSRFHAKYPFSSSRKPIINFCEVCRQRRIKNGVVARYHFCYSCGRARSKDFQREHPIIIGGPIIQNYCGQCLKDVRATESIIDSSVLGVASDNAVSCNSTSDLTQRASKKGRVGSRGDKPSISGASRRSEGRRTHQEDSDSSSIQSTNPRTVYPKSLKPSPVDSTIQKTDATSTHQFQDQKYCPKRVSASANRRAERNSASYVEESTTPQETSFRGAGKYRSPYIEDSTSARHSRITTLTYDSDPEYTEPQVNTRRRPVADASKRGRVAALTRESTKPAVECTTRPGTKSNSSNRGSGSSVRFEEPTDTLHDEEPGLATAHAVSVDDGDDMYQAKETGTSKSGAPSRLPAQKSTGRYAKSDNGDYESTQAHTGRLSDDNIQTGSFMPHASLSGFSRGAFGDAFGAFESSKHDYPPKSSYSAGDGSPKAAKTRTNRPTSGGVFRSFFSGYGGTKAKGSQGQESPSRSRTFDFSRPGAGRKVKDDCAAAVDDCAPEDHRDQHSPLYESFPSTDYGIHTAFTNTQYDYQYHDDEETLPGGNPYYKPRRHNYAATFAAAFDAASGWKRQKARNSRRKRELHEIPEPIVEEASSICSSESEPERMLLEYNITDSSTESDIFSDVGCEDMSSEGSTDVEAVQKGMVILSKK